VIGPWYGVSGVREFVDLVDSVGAGGGRRGEREGSEVRGTKYERRAGRPRAVRERERRRRAVRLPRSDGTLESGIA